jgi:heme-degrading monooxygenase HmoA
MIAVIFEVWPDAAHRQDYFDLAAGLKAELERIDGFISVERFVSIADESKILSLSFWRDEEAVKRWRTHAEHRAAQRAGRSEVFRDYRLRVASVIRDYGMFERDEVKNCVHSGTELRPAMVQMARFWKARRALNSRFGR